MPQLKAISPIIATIIILLVTIAIAGAGYSYISTYWSGLLGKQIEVVSSFCAGEGQAKIMVKNIGTNPVRTGEIAVINPNTGEDLTQDVSWAPSVSDPGLVLELRFEEGSGTRATDTSGQENHGTIYGATWVTDPERGDVLSFDGNDDYVGDIGDLGIPQNGPATVSGWFKFDRLAKESGVTQSLYTFFYQSPIENYLYLPGADLFPGAGLVIDNWYHMVLTWDGQTDTAELYVNFDEYDGDIWVQGTPDDMPALNNFKVGAPYAFDGQIDEIMVFNRVLLDDEIKALYENSVPVQPGETATLTHACPGRCRYNLVLGGAAKEAMAEC